LVNGYVFITGGDRGIGRATSILFASRGFHVIYSYYRDRSSAENTCIEIMKNGGECLYIQMDVSSKESVSQAYSFVSSKIPYLNVLVNNAGILHVGDIEDIDPSSWRRVIEINLTGVFLVTKTFLPLLKKAPWASIVNLASIAGQTGNIVASTAYAASKAGVIGFTRRLAVELAKYGIRVNAVAPSFVETDMVRDYIDTPEKRERIKSLHPLNDIAKPEDIAETIYFLATPVSRFITGQVIGVNGGRLTC